MDPYRRAPATDPAGSGDVDAGAAALTEAPEDRGGPVREERPVTAGEHCGYPAPLGSE